MNVRAKELGVYAGMRRRPGAVFQIPDDKPIPKWVEVVPDETKQEPANAGAPAPVALSELAPKPKKRGRPPQTFREIAEEST